MGHLHSWKHREHPLVSTDGMIIEWCSAHLVPIVAVTMLTRTPAPEVVAPEERGDPLPERLQPFQKGCLKFFQAQPRETLSMKIRVLMPVYQKRGATHCMIIQKKRRQRLFAKETRSVLLPPSQQVFTVSRIFSESLWRGVLIGHRSLRLRCNISSTLTNSLFLVVLW